MTTHTTKQFVHIPADAVALEGELILPPGTQGVVAFAHGSGSSRHSPRNTFVAGVLQSAGLGTLLFDLLTRAEDTDYETRFDIALLTRRLIAATHWLHQQPQTKTLAIGYFGASTGAAAALQAARRGDRQSRRWCPAGDALTSPEPPSRKCRRQRC